MKLLGRDISTQNVLAAVSERLFARGLTGMPDAGEVTSEGVEGRVDPLTFYVNALGEHADSTRGLPLETHRDGLSGQAVVLAKRAFRRVGQLFINEAFGRQVAFNGHVRDSYAQLSKEVLTLRHRLAQLEHTLASRAVTPTVTAPPRPARVEVAKKAPVKAKPAPIKVVAPVMAVPVKAPVRPSVKVTAKVSVKPKKSRGSI